MTNLHQDNQVEPFFITTEVVAELITAGCQFEPPSQFATTRLPEALAGLPMRSRRPGPASYRRERSNAGSEAH